MRQVAFFYRCFRCKTTFTLPQEEQNDERCQQMLENSPCGVCGKGRVEYLGKLEFD